MPERKQFSAAILIFMLLSRRLLPLVQHWPTLQDPEYTTALARASDHNLPNIEEATNYPFAPVDRAQWALRFDWYARAHALPLVTEDCSFDDIEDLPMDTQQAIIDGCRYGFFKWFQGWFVPQDPLSKAAAIVVITRILLPNQEFPDVKEFREPYMIEAVRLGVLHQPNHPYLMYPISTYELLLILRRAHQLTP
jgi:hypothetical protein